MMNFRECGCQFTDLLGKSVDWHPHSQNSGQDPLLNPIPGEGGGHYGPDDRKRSAVSTGFGLGSPKFMTLFLSMSDKTQ